MSDAEAPGAAEKPPTGRGRRRFTVDALFSDTRAQSIGVRDLPDAKVIELARIVGDPRQPRRTFDPDRLEELTSSIRAEGVLQPIVVRFDANGDRYIIVHGERRFRAAKRAGLEVIPALIRDVPADRRLLQQLMENVVRDDLNAIDRASALRELKAQLGDPPWEDVAAAVGIRRSRLFQLLGTGKLSTETRTEIEAGRLSEKQSRLLQGMPAGKQAAMRELLMTTKVPANVATRIARAYRALPIEDDDPDAARTTLHNLQQLVAASDPASMRQQTAMLLNAIRASHAQEHADNRPLKQIVNLVAAPTYSANRMTAEIASLVRILAAMPRDALTVDDAIYQSLKELRETLQMVIADADQ